MSTATIARVNIRLKFGGDGYRYFTGRMLRNQKIRKIWEKIEDLVLNMGSIGGKGSDSWRQARREVHDKRWKKSTPISD